MGKINILLVDDFQLLLDIWTVMFNGDPRFKVVGQALDTKKAVQIAKRTKPEIVLIDFNKKPMEGLETARKIRETSPYTKAVGLTMSSMLSYAAGMVKAGTSGYLTKNSSRDELIDAILMVKAGRFYLSAEVQELVQGIGINDKGYHYLVNFLSPRELQIANAIKNGESSKEIGLNLGISAKTVEVHRYNILRKLRLKNTAALVNYIYNFGY